MTIRTPTKAIKLMDNSLVIDVFGSGLFRFVHPYFLLGLLFVPLFFYIRHVWSKTLKPQTIQLPTTRIVADVYRKTTVHKYIWLPNFLRALVIILLFISLARPQFGRIEKQTFSEGIDIALILDVSLSMRAGDFHPNRLEAAKDVLQEFVRNRTGDRLSLTIFGTDAVTLVPLTLDYGVVSNFIDKVRFNLVNGDSTALGLGLANALAKLKDSEAKSKIAILLTDGENNAGKIDPLKAAEAAKTLGVKVYTIGVGSVQTGYGVFGMGMEPSIDEPTLQSMAQMTNGLYFRATDNEKLSQIYKEIDTLEKSNIESTQFDNFNELFIYFLIPALIILLLELIARYSRWIKIP